MNILYATSINNKDQVSPIQRKHKQVCSVKHKALKLLTLNELFENFAFVPE